MSKAIAQEYLGIAAVIFTIALVLAVILGSIITGISIASAQYNERVKACIDAGGSWSQGSRELGKIEVCKQ